MVDVYLFPVTAAAGADIWLRPFILGPSTIELAPSPVAVILGAPMPWLVKGAPPVTASTHDDRVPYVLPGGVAARSLYLDLLNRYGAVEGARIYAAMQAEAKGPFAPGKKHHAAHVAWARDAGVEPIGRS